MIGKGGGGGGGAGFGPNSNRFGILSDKKKKKKIPSHRFNFFYPKF